MALIMEQTTDYGIVAEYWKLGSFTIDTTRKETTFVLYLYTKKGVGKYLESYCVSDFMEYEDKTLFDQYFNGKGTVYKDWQTACYMYTKENVPFFKDAVDDPEESGIY